MMTAFRVILLIALALSGIGIIADDHNRVYLLILFALAGALLLVSFAVGG